MSNESHGRERENRAVSSDEEAPRHLDMEYGSEQKTSCLTIGSTETFSISMM
jgi:hypothetical protein